MTPKQFNQLGLIDPILKALEAEGYTHPTPIQEQAIPIVLQEKDLLGCAQTGTGKTAAFAIPMLQLLSAKPATRGPKKIQALILTPTRELAIQIGESFTAYGRNLSVSNLVIFGGVPQGPQVKALRSGVDILVATPGRLLDLIGQGFISLQDINIFVLDEADRMLDMGFIHDVKKVVQRLPAQRQSLFFSATMPPEIQKLANTILVKPEKVEVTPVSSTAETITQSLYFVDQKEKKKLLVHILQDKKIDRVLVFTRTKHGADRLVKDLHKAGISAEAIHGNKSQNARQRALSNFKNGATRVLLATDIAARGIDIDDLAYVINYELGDVPETYVHRIGRTGRAGNSGTAIAFCDVEELDNLKGIQKLIGFKIPVVEAHPFLPADSDVVQFRAPKNKEVVPRANAIPAPVQGNNNRRNHQKKKKPQQQQAAMATAGSDKPRQEQNRPAKQQGQKPHKPATEQAEPMQQQAGRRKPDPRNDLDW
ncbi:DEAD/DEAH box helicase [Taibaiella chishuiensis]|uniref:DEAD-box ATP-dependent RNA helicase RhpA n=1 Tax=Taibaiella chishuiensis TaxID=1434707 RepID=A0A2P8DAJ1_9BACT|nr:DEAD/DEAH box helicase [Taibaiella chishuiensis]PSK94240.1 ATP-dependent RNA helicase RhlE [Taibaiella chishuiensis]